VAPLVSILIPAYNAEAHLAETIESALGQSYPNKEIIVVDDGSKDGTLQLARQFAARGVIVVTQSNAGAATARNKAYSVSRGEFIQWLDADDLLSTDKINLQMRAFASDPNKRKLLSSGWGYFINRPQKASFIRTPLWEDLSPGEWLVRKLELNLHMQTATWLVSRDVCEAAGSWDARLLGDDDGEYFCRILLASDGVRFVPGARVFYRRSSGSLSYIGASTRKMEAQFLSMKLHIEKLLALENSPRVRAACVTYLQRYLIYFYPELPEIVRQAHSLAAELGGGLTTPALPAKYRWIQKIFGWRFGKLAWVMLPRFRESMAHRWDKTLACFETPNAAAVSGVEVERFS
jgi:glycosyltransferase involved in cell wall biosynthesis